METEAILWSVQVPSDIQVPAVFWYFGFPWGTEWQLKAGGAPAGPVCYCTICQETLASQCHLQGLVYFIQWWFSIKDTSVFPTGKCPNHWVREFYTHMLCSSYISRMVCLDLFLQGGVDFSAPSVFFPLSSCRCHLGIFIRDEKIELKLLKLGRELPDLLFLHVGFMLALSQSCHIKGGCWLLCFGRNASFQKI